MVLTDLIFMLVQLELDGWFIQVLRRGVVQRLIRSTEVRGLKQLATGERGRTPISGFTFSEI